MEQLKANMIGFDDTVCITCVGTVSIMDEFQRLLTKMKEETGVMSVKTIFDFIIENRVYCNVKIKGLIRNYHLRKYIDLVKQADLYISYEYAVEAVMVYQYQLEKRARARLKIDFSKADKDIVERMEDLSQNTRWKEKFLICP